MSSRSSSVEIAVGVSVDGQFGRSFEGRAALAGLARLRHVFVALEDLDLGQGQDSLLARELDAHVTRLGHGGFVRNNACPNLRENKIAISMSDASCGRTALGQDFQSERLHRLHVVGGQLDHIGVGLAGASSVDDSVFSGVDRGTGLGGDLGRDHRLPRKGF